MIVRRVSGGSMMPTLRPGDIVIGWGRPLRSGRIVIATMAGNDVVKRLKSQRADKWYLVGDDSLHSTDSRQYGSVSESAILGTVMIVLPTAVNPPKPLTPYALWCGRLAAAVLIVMILLHLYRIDTFLPLIDQALPGGYNWATTIGLVIILSELFAIPFVLRMRLSPLAHLISGALIVLAPLWWVLIAIWTYGRGVDTAQLGQFASVPSTPLSLLANIVWLAASCYVLYALGYRRLSWPKRRMV